MKALVFDGRLHLRTDYPVPQPEEGEVLVKVRRVGICNTDLEILKGYAQFHGVLGHEFVGELEDGSRVVGEINVSDGVCPACRRGDFTHCEQRSVLGIHAHDGAFAEYLTLPRQNLHLVPPAISDEEAVFVEPLAAAVEILEQTHIKPTDSVLVIGDGKLGLLCAQVLALCGSEVTVFGHHPDKLSLLKDRGLLLRSDHAALREKYDVVVDCTGQPEGFELAWQKVRSRGLLVMKSTFHGTQEVALSLLVVAELRLLGSRCGPFLPALRLLERGQVEVKRLIAGVYPITEGLRAFEQAASRGALKIQVVF